MPIFRLSQITVLATAGGPASAVLAKTSTTPEHSPITSLLPIMAVVGVAFLTIGLALPVLPLHVHLGLGRSTFVVGLVTGSQFAAALLSRVWAGRVADRSGPKQAVVAGLLGAVTAGSFYLISLCFMPMPAISVGVLLLGRAVLGAAESFIITGAAAWGLALAGPQNAGRVIAWVGMAMFAAMATGAPLGTMLFAKGGFAAVALATVLIPLLTLALVAPLRATPAQRGTPAGLLGVARAVWLPGLGSALSSIGFGAMIGFSALLATERGWSPVWLTFSSFAFALVAARLFLGQVPDRVGGAKVALVSIFIETTGLALLGLATGRIVAVLGAALTGFGFSLVYPGLGVEAVRRAPPQSRGLAMGAYTVFLDVALGFGSPALGLLAGRAGPGSVFLASAVVVFGAAIIAVRLLMDR